MKLIRIVPFATIDLDTECMAETIGRRLRIPVLEEHIEIDYSRAYDAARGQYRARALIEQLPLPAEAEIVLGLTSLDLFIPIFTFVFGEGLLGRRLGVVSSYRLDEMRYSGSADAERLAARVIKESVHEIGHAVGLVHCRSPLCVMQPSGDAGEVDLKSDDFCAGCRAAIGGQFTSIAIEVNCPPIET